MRQKTAILIFANSAKAEGLNKPFKKSTVLFNALNSQIKNKVKQTNLPYFIITEKEQIGDTFGSRFTNAIQFVFNKGFDNIITVGNDTPHLQKKHILEANRKLKSNNNSLVLGPSQDGGFYLMAIKKSLFNSKDFLNLPWQTASLNNRILKLLALKKVKISLLESLIDIDSTKDAITILNSFRNLPVLIKNILFQIIASAKTIANFQFQFFKPIKNTSNYNKGSPFIFST